MIKLGDFTASSHGRRCTCLLLPIVIAEKVALLRRFLVRKRDEYGALSADIDGLQAELAVDRADALEQTVI